MWLKVIEFSIVLLLTLQNEASAAEVKELTGLKPGQTIEINGDIEEAQFDDPSQIYQIDLQEAGTEDGEGDIHLHISVRYGFAKIVLNNWVNGTWGSEKEYYLPGYQRSHTVLIAARDSSFHIMVNGVKAIFKYRMPKENLEKIKYLVIGGKFDVSDIDLETTQCH